MMRPTFTSRSSNCFKTSFQNGVPETEAQLTSGPSQEPACFAAMAEKDLIIIQCMATHHGQWPHLCLD